MLKSVTGVTFLSEYQERAILMQYKSLDDMDNRLLFDEHIIMKHPELSEEDIAHAWENAIASRSRRSDDYIAIGFDSNGRLLQICAIRLESGDWLVYHALTPPQDSTYKEVGIDRRK